jgi:hypothetical protein
LGASSPRCSHERLPNLNVQIHSVKIIGQSELLKFFRLRNPGQPRRRKMPSGILMDPVLLCKREVCRERELRGRESKLSYDFMKG